MRASVSIEAPQRLSGLSGSLPMKPMARSATPEKAASAGPEALHDNSATASTVAGQGTQTRKSSIQTRSCSTASLEPSKSQSMLIFIQSTNRST